jgi:ParB-like chromosome segregation protein Spo0J
MTSTTERMSILYEPVSKLTPGEDGLLPPLSDEEFAALKADIKKEKGVLVPISVDEDNVIIDGHHRWRACKELGIDVPTRMHSPLDPAEKEDLALALNLNRRNLSQAQKRDVIAAVLRQHPKRSARQTAAAVGVDHKTVISVQKELEERGESPHVEKRTDSKGRKQPASKTKGTSGRRKASGSKSADAKPRARTRAERQAKATKTGETTLSITFREKDAELPARIQRIAGDDLATNAWCVRVFRKAVEDAESSEQKASEGIDMTRRRYRIVVAWYARRFRAIWHRAWNAPVSELEAELNEAKRKRDT